MQGKPHPGALSRLATVRHPVVPALALALSVVAVVVLASCGGGTDAKLLPGNTAQEITENLDRVQQYAEEGECVGAADAAGEVNAQVETLTDVDPKLVEALKRGTGRLSEVIATCEEEPLETTEPSEEEEEGEEQEERARPPGQVKKEEREHEAEEAAPEGEEEKPKKHEPGPPETTPAEPPATPPGEGGGTPSPGGVGPGTPVEPEGD